MLSQPPGIQCPTFFNLCHVWAFIKRWLIRQKGVIGLFWDYFGFYLSFYFSYGDYWLMGLFYCDVSHSIWSIDGSMRKLRRSCPSHIKPAGSSWRMKCKSEVLKGTIPGNDVPGVSSSSLQCLKSGSGLLIGSSKWLCCFREQWPVSHLIAFQKMVLVHCMICFVIFGFGFWRKVLSVCRFYC